MKKSKKTFQDIFGKKGITTILKYLFSLLLMMYACLTSEDAYYFLIGTIELFLIFLSSNLLCKKYKFGYFLNCVLLFLYNAQMLVLIFGNSFITLMMLTNLDSLKALSGRAGTYLFGFGLTVLFSALPIKESSILNKYTISGIAFLFGLEFCFLASFGNWYSPMYGYAIVARQFYVKQQTVQKVAKAVSDNLDAVRSICTEFYSEEISDYRKKDVGLYENPNIILIFTEGLSSNVISDERNITPNIQKWMDKSLCFENYYNHTFATYRGLNGQLYSGYQLGDIEYNDLISLQSIFSDMGYTTTFINTEPENEDFTNYLEHMGFDEVITDQEIRHIGLADSISDKDAYEMLYELAQKKLSLYEPFFLSVYTFGTHASFDSTAEKYGDGKDSVLNRFADMDAQFGSFMEKVYKNPNFNNTIVVFTTDHATYQDDPFTSAFSKYQRFYQSFDRIPLFISYKGIEPELIDADGRNSLDLAPTILDYLDMSAPNYFLGSSLFAKEAGSILETVYHDSVVTFSSADGIMQELEEGVCTNILEKIHKYYVTKALSE